MNTETKAVTTRAEAIRLLVNQDVAKWGEEERQASLEMRSGESHGLLLNALGANAEMDGDMTTARRYYAEARVVMTGKDRRVLRNGG